jgi:PAS domain S-box-containing protein
VEPVSTATIVIGLAGVAFMFGLAVHAAGRPLSPGAGAFAAYSALAGLRLLMDVMLPLLPPPWAAGALVVKHATIWLAPLAGFLFALHIAAEARGVGRWSSGPFWAAGAIVIAIVVTNPIHGWYLRSPWLRDAYEIGPLGWGMVAIANVGVLAIVVLLAAAMTHAEGRRAPLALLIVGTLVNWAAAFLPLFAWSPFGFGPVDVIMRTATAGLFALALFGFGLLHLVPFGREAVLRRMDDGWLVLDPAGRIADLNRAAERMFQVTAREVIGREASDALLGVVGLDAMESRHATIAYETALRTTAGRGPDRHLDVHGTPVLNRHGRLLGSTLLVRDVTALRRAEALALERERALAALKERERVARELHDGLAQVLGFVRLQAEAARGLLERDAATAEAYLSRLAETALDAHGEVRSFIAGSAAATETDLMTAIAAALRRVGEEARVGVELRVDEGLDDDALAQPVAAHLLRIVQEALHNIRKHARASHVTLTVTADDAWVQVEVVDDGAGLPDPANPLTSWGFGLRFMHERAEAAGGSLAIASCSAGGTRVTVRVPRREAPSVTPGAAPEAILDAPRGG